mmetsp:Transcript_8105/g.23771  ORF Transcript_8105/g.23771 Transcript_8105/m.23771 type:complete len:229 (+) Transcript_8105:374-1060(+)
MPFEPPGAPGAAGRGRGLAHEVRRPRRHGPHVRGRARAVPQGRGRAAPGLAPARLQPQPDGPAWSLRLGRCRRLRLRARLGRGPREGSGTAAQRGQGRRRRCCSASGPEGDAGRDALRADGGAPVMAAGPRAPRRGRWSAARGGLRRRPWFRPRRPAAEQRRPHSVGRPSTCGEERRHCDAQGAPEPAAGEGACRGAAVEPRRLGGGRPHSSEAWRACTSSWGQRDGG